jgi:hypothetical protein
MSNTKHTPGPWLVNDCTRRPSTSHTYRYRICVGEGRDAEELAIVETYSQLPPEPGCENEANARLIAAAPDLLAALREVSLCFGTGEASEEWWAEQHDNYVPEGRNSVDCRNDVLDRARAAIAAATKE